MQKARNDTYQADDQKTNQKLTMKEQRNPFFFLPKEEKISHYLSLNLLPFSPQRKSIGLDIRKPWF